MIVLTWHRVDRVLGFFPVVRIGTTPHPSAVGECVPLGGTHLPSAEGVGVPVRTRGQTLLYSMYCIYVLPQTKAKGTHTPGAWWPRCAVSGLSVDRRPPRPSHWSQDQAWLYFSSWIFLAAEKTASESSADTHPSTHLGHGGLRVRPLASVWTFGDHPGRHTEVRIKHDFTSVPESSWLWRKLHQKVQLFQCEGGGKCTGLPAGLTIKENLGDPSLQSAASDGQLNMPFQKVRALPKGAPPSKRCTPFQKVHALPKWARPFSTIGQSWTCPSKRGVASQKGCALSKGAHSPKRGAPFPSVKQWAKNLEWMKE